MPDVITPRGLARALADHLAPSGRIIEPCCGEGHILDCLPAGTAWCELKRGRDFLQWRESVDWIITNPPWSQIRAILRHAFEVADRVAFLMTVNHAWTTARLRDARAAGFGIREILLMETPRSFPPSGFQLGMVVYVRGHRGPIALHDLPGGW